MRNVYRESLLYTSFFPVYEVSGGNNIKYNNNIPAPIKTSPSYRFTVLKINPSKTDLYKTENIS